MDSSPGLAPVTPVGIDHHSFAVAFRDIQNGFSPATGYLGQYETKNENTLLHKMTVPNDIRKQKRLHSSKRQRTVSNRSLGFAIFKDMRLKSQGHGHNMPANRTQKQQLAALPPISKSALRKLFGGDTMSLFDFSAT